jgi:hypothetical protein
VQRTGGKRVVGRIALTLLTLLLLAPSTTWAAKLTCLTGTDPSVTYNAANISALRQTIETQCVCAQFDGGGSRRHGNYVRCVTTQITLATIAGTLRPQCKGTVRKYCTSSTCGVPASKGVRSWLTTGITGKVTCAIKPTSTGLFSPRVVVEPAARGGRSTGLTATDVRAFAMDPLTPSTLYAGGGGGVFKSTDAGAHWAAGTRLLPYGPVTAVVVDPVTPSTVYAAATGAANVVYKSMDVIAAGAYQSGDRRTMACWLSVQVG